MTDNKVYFDEEEMWKLKGYTNNKNPILFDESLSDRAKLIYMQLKARDFGDKKGYAYPGHERIAEENDCSVSSVKRAINELTKAGLIRKKQRGLNKTNRYNFLPLSNRYPQLKDSSPVTEQGSSPMTGLDSSPVNYKELKVEELKEKEAKASKEAAADIDNNSTKNNQLSNETCNLFEEVFNRELTANEKKTLANKEQNILNGVLKLIKHDRNANKIDKPIAYIVSLIERYNNGEDIKQQVDDVIKGNYQSNSNTYQLASEIESTVDYDEIEELYNRMSEDKEIKKEFNYNSSIALKEETQKLFFEVLNRNMQSFDAKILLKRVTGDELQDILKTAKELNQNEDRKDIEDISDLKKLCE